MNSEERMKNNMDMVVNFFSDFLDAAEDYLYENRNDEEKVNHLQKILAENNPFGADLMDTLHKLHKYNENIKERL